MTYGTTANRHRGRSKHLGGPVHGMFMEWRNTTKIFLIYGNVFQCLLDDGIAKICNHMMAFWATYKIAHPIQPARQYYFALFWSALKKPSWELNFHAHFFNIIIKQTSKTLAECLASKFRVLWNFPVLFSLKFCACVKVFFTHHYTW